MDVLSLEDHVERVIDRARVAVEHTPFTSETYHSLDNMLPLTRKSKVTPIHLDVNIAFVPLYMPAGVRGIANRSSAIMAQVMNTPTYPHPVLQRECEVFAEHLEEAEFAWNRHFPTPSIAQFFPVYSDVDLQTGLLIIEDAFERVVDLYTH